MNSLAVKISSRSHGIWNSACVPTMAPHSQSNTLHLPRGTVCVIDSGFKRAHDAGAAYACVFHEEDLEPLCPPRCMMLLCASHPRLAFLHPRWCCATG